MSDERPLFPFYFIGPKTVETVGDVLPETAEQAKQPITVNAGMKDFRPVNQNRISTANNGKDLSEEGPKASSATVVAESSLSELTASPAVIVEENADAAKESNPEEPSGPQDEPEVEQTTGDPEQPVRESIPEVQMNTISSSLLT